MSALPTQASTEVRIPRAPRLRLAPQHIPVAATITLFVAMATFGSIAYDGFFSPQVFLNLLIDNAFVCIVAVGMTFVILSGGIDLSVGSVIALATMISASLVEQHGWPPGIVIPLVLVLGAGFGTTMGLLIERFRLQPFIVTLAGMFLARGLCYLISIDSISITHEFYAWAGQWRLPVWGGGASLSLSALLALAVVAVAAFVAHGTQFGRTVYAIGGNAHSAMLMGLPVARTTVQVYALSGLCSALAGVVFTFYMQSGYGLHAMGLELDAIAAVVIGGTLLSGGVGYVLGTLFGVLILGMIQTLIMFDGSLSSWWTRIVIGALLFIFCLLQRLFETGRRTSA
ncbi:sugar ABC transporter permease YjfF [Caldimonas thermodepolymerans]|jgi:Ribose/xylose/arabinose/galactoside ABC-type transport systems, permease components|uniref:Monosaccharide ABC transporter membrane protein (CUT2 family) n=1 Tax=Caldimonas thermodepolymerans TaxID=215580 RepID=A0A2S5T109_9BURK|nr:galactofuranose ABC transporter, permease protein YjfF [Caldimonas thermodepolymerans]PPE68694.1 sugar ABC transporter permease YjfF [Caldimonas thermodepolymerans]QPC31530.1 sugar ABC transporter permease YjfF [Caldimonas thermodepolymerans]RDH95121.1 monosaccharide ABC transporter membrane protein (CUT2 family) [Caldimonas thermodepolymerans]TCP03254.1 monosaccharide ABC transporter membrane protein (CUT2 family) [Caldimonas thermodepolymerans]UZG44282.1 sugar ABC transporter permease Yjf